VLYSVCGQPNCIDGAVPRAGLTLDPSWDLYSTTEDGGAFGEGTVFKLTPPAAGQTLWTETVLHVTSSNTVPPPHGTLFAPPSPVVP
jgi:uncharacterized repeat protein (TIGR03803 family)